MTYRVDFPDGDPSLTKTRADLARKDGPPIPGSLHATKGSRWETAMRVYEQIGDVLRKGAPLLARTLHRPGKSPTPSFRLPGESRSDHGAPQEKEEITP